MTVPQDSQDRRGLLRDALRAIDEMQVRLDASERRHREPIAVVGLSCRFPGAADDPDGFWKLLQDGVDAIREAPADRWAARSAARPLGGYLDRIDQFDAGFFGISPREAVTMDPQHRLLLEAVWEALERGGHAPDRLSGSRTGVFVGITTSDYAQILRVGEGASSDVYSATGNALNAAAGRISFLLGLRGPTMSIDTACSSSLVAVHVACQSLRSGESRMALACGVNLVLLPHAGALFTKWGMMASDGRCKTFDAAADGFVRSEGCAAIVLKRLSDAEADGDDVLGIIRGSAVNSDGRSSGLTVPNGPAQEEVIRTALTSASLEPGAVDYVEAHGTGTPLGDPIEVEALARVFGTAGPRTSPLLVGSVKTNIGHVEAASGLAGLIKVLLSLQHELLPAHLHFNTPSPRMDWSQWPITVASSARPWRRGDRPRIAGVSAFGFSGTNAHVIVEEAPVRAPRATTTRRPVQILTLSSKSQAGLTGLATRWVDRIARTPQMIQDLAFTANTGRSHLGVRCAVVAETPEEIAAALRACAVGEPHPALQVGEWGGVQRPRLAWAFTGQGAQYVNMGRELFEADPRFRGTLEHCSTVLDPLIGRSLVELLYPAASAAEAAQAELNQTKYTQPALFAVEYSLAALLRECGVEPSVVLGHSVGEFVAACVAGVFELDRALELVAHRGRLMQSLPAGGTMAAVFAPPAVVLPHVEARADQVAVAAVNGPALTVIGGTEAAVRDVTAKLDRDGVRSQMLAVSHAFHSPLVDPILAEFQRIAAGVERRDPGVPLISNVTAAVVDRADVLDGAYWRRHARETVRFAESVATLGRFGCDFVVEVGPHPALTAAGRSVPDGPARWLPTLRRGQGDWKVLLATLGELYLAGTEVNWASLDRPFGSRRVDAPTYPFQRQRYWIEAAEETPRPEDEPRSRQTMVHPLLGRRLRSPGLSGMVFERELVDSAELCVREHKVFGMVVVPGAAYLEMALAAGTLAAGGPVVVRDVAIQEPLVPGDAGRIVQTVLDPDGEGWTARILSRPAGSEQDDWRLHASATVERRTTDAELVTIALGLTLGEGQPLEREDYYAQLVQAGVDYGPAFRGLDGIVAGNASATASLLLTDSVLSELSRFGVHPAVLDGAFQLLGAALGSLPRNSEDSTVYLPIGAERFAQFRPVAGDLQAVARVRMGDPGTDILTGDIAISTTFGEPVALIEGLRCRRATAAALRRALGAESNTLLHSIEWEPVAPVGPRQSGPRSWLILADARGVADALATSLTARGDGVAIVRAGEPGAPASALALAVEQRPITDVVHLWSLDASAAADSNGAEQRWLTCTSLVELARAAGHLAAPPRTTVVTAGAQPAGNDATTAQPVQALAWGMARTLANEYPSLSCRLVDLTSAAADRATIDALLAELDEADRAEPQIALRQEGRLAPRLVKDSRREASGVPRLPAPREPFTLTITERGVLDNLRLEPLEVPDPEPHEVQIRVSASGLNFRDVLSALGMYPGEPGPLGGEVVGQVVAVGSCVTRFRPGDEVLALTPRGFCSRVNTPESLAWQRPAWMSEQDAATIPIVFHTAHYALNHVGHMTRGERVLVHAGAGGVGIAAIQLAMHAGAEVFATAGSPEKRAFLHGLGVQHVMDSRSLSFADEIRVLTMGEGIDIVLNSLAGEFIPRSMSLLRAGGRFLELGKTDLWDQARASALNPHVRYSAIFLGDVCQSSPRVVEQMYAEMMPLFESRTLAALPSRSYAIDEAVDAFRFMAQARHIGKIVLWQQPASERPVVRRDGAYLVTGGFGGVGLHVARWLARAGAARIVLAGRRTDTADAANIVSELSAGGVRVVAVAADVTDAAALTAAVHAAESDGHALRGIVHAAGVLDDGVIDQLTDQRIEGVIRPKLDGGRALGEIARGRDLDFLVFCSAGAAIFGPAGQGSYAAANAGLDALAASLRGAGVRASSINWGAWQDTGMTGRMSAADHRRWIDAGVLQLEPADAIGAMESVIRSGRAQMAVLAADWGRVTSGPQQRVGGRLLARLGRSSKRTAVGPGRADSETFRRQLDAAPLEEKHDRLAAHVREQVRRVLGMPAAAPLRAGTGFADLGMDSLMSVELSNRLRESLGCSLPATLAFEQPTVERLVDFLARQVVKLDVAQDATSGPSAEEQARARLLVDVERLTDEQVEQTLAAELDSAGY